MQTLQQMKIAALASIAFLCMAATNPQAYGSAKERGVMENPSLRHENGPVLNQKQFKKTLFNYDFDGYYNDGGNNTAIVFGNSNSNTVTTNETFAFVNEPSGCSSCAISWSQETTGNFNFFNYGDSGLMSIQLSSGQIAEFLVTISTDSTSESREVVFQAP